MKKKYFYLKLLFFSIALLNSITPLDLIPHQKEWLIGLGLFEPQ